MWAWVAAPLLVACLSASALAEVAGGPSPPSDLRGLLDRLAPSRTESSPRVQVRGWVERDGPSPALVVEVDAGPSLKIVATPGVTVTPELRSGLEWLDGQPATVSDPAVTYFTTAPQVRLPFRAEDGRPVSARVEYAYCVVGYQCLFGEQELSVATVPGCISSPEVQHC